MSSKNVPVTVQILDKEYRVACPEEEREALMASGRHLNKKMKEMKEIVEMNLLGPFMHGEKPLVQSGLS